MTATTLFGHMPTPGHLATQCAVVVLLSSLRNRDATSERAIVLTREARKRDGRADPPGTLALILLLRQRCVRRRRSVPGNKSPTLVIS